MAHRTRKFDGYYRSTEPSFCLHLVGPCPARNANEARRGAARDELGARAVAFTASCRTVHLECEAATITPVNEPRGSHKEILNDQDSAHLFRKHRRAHHRPALRSRARDRA